METTTNKRQWDQDIESQKKKIKEIESDLQLGKAKLIDLEISKSIDILKEQFVFVQPDFYDNLKITTTCVKNEKNGWNSFVTKNSITIESKIGNLECIFSIDIGIEKSTMETDEWNKIRVYISKPSKNLKLTITQGTMLTKILKLITTKELLSPPEIKLDFFDKNDNAFAQLFFKAIGLFLKIHYNVTCADELVQNWVEKTIITVK